MAEQKTIAAKRIADNALLLPKTSNQHMLAEYYSMADAFVICSKKENFPTTCLEAQCCGTPVAGFNTGGTVETSLYGKKYFADYGDIPTLAQCVRDLLAASHDQLAANAESAFSREQMFRNYLDEYDRDGRKERILLIDVNCKNSSTGKIVYDLFSNLNKNGRTAAVCYGRGEYIDEPGIYKFGLDWETNIHAAAARITGYNGCFSPFSTRRLLRYIDEFKPDVIHIHELHAYFVNIRPLIEYIKKKGIKVVWTFHCEYMYTGKCGYAYDCPNFQTECNNCPFLRDYPKSLFFDKTRQMFHMKKSLLNDFDMTIVTPSKWLADRVGLSFLKEKPTRVIFNGIDTSLFYPVELSSEFRASLEIPGDHKLVLALAPDILCERKGGQWVLKLAEHMKDEKVFFILVGATEADLN